MKENIMNPYQKTTTIIIDDNGDDEMKVKKMKKTSCFCFDGKSASLVVAILAIFHSITNIIFATKVGIIYFYFHFFCF